LQEGLFKLEGQDVILAQDPWNEDVDANREDILQALVRDNKGF
jgi:hypothetical protein